MKLITTLALLLFLSLPSPLMAESPAIKMSNLFFDCDLIVEAQITGHSNDHVKIRIIDVFYDNKYGIVKGDYLILFADFQDACNQFHISNAIEKKKGLFFLSMIENSWSVTHGIVGFYNEQEVAIPFYEEGVSIRLTSQQWEEQIHQYYSEFKMSKDNKIYAQKPEEEVRSTQLSALVYLQYSRIYRSLPPIDQEAVSGLFNEVEIEGGYIKAAENKTH